MLVDNLVIWQRIVSLQEDLQTSQEDVEEVVVEGLLVGVSITEEKEKEEEINLISFLSENL